MIYLPFREKRIKKTSRGGVMGLILYNCVSANFLAFNCFSRIV